MARIELTTPDGRRIEIDPDMIGILEDAAPGLYASSAKSVLYLGAELKMQAVRETVAQIRALEGKKKS